jgi:hypothetical protein
MLQAWGLYKADVLFLAGQHSAAVLAGRKAIGEPPMLRSSFFAGRFCRWLAMVSEDPPEVVTHRKHIIRMVQELQNFDAVDQVEIMCAYAMSERQPESKAPRNPLLREKLKDLPQAISDQLFRLGMLV